MKPVILSIFFVNSGAIQKAGEKALTLGIGTAQVLAMVRDFRTQDASTPVVLMGYANPVERYDLKHGAGAFIRDAAAAGVDGVLIVDYPPEECEAFAAALKAERIHILAPFPGKSSVGIEVPNAVKTKVIMRIMLESSSAK